MKATKLSWIIGVFLTVICAGVNASAGKYFNRVVYVLFENTGYLKTIKQPFFSKLSQSGANFAAFTAETHPSQGNYIALTSGDLNGVKNDANYDLNVNNIVDLLDARNITWKVYAEAYPGNCFQGLKSGSYARKHNPFISYTSIQKNVNRCANIVDASQFDKDAASGQLPNYVFYVPDIKNDGHDTGVSYADKWYSKKFSPYVNDPVFMNDTILITTFDENDGTNGNQIYTSIVGPHVKAVSVTAQVSHYSLLKLMEDNWDLGNLGKLDATAAPIPENIWK
ncbi:hypothetical protein CIK05_13505 [Bdellovibrio sp. qaytius]|nr:hypothetical protein CIK05_13505 [Bdellovibrio sp. qaytius]